MAVRKNLVLGGSGTIGKALVSELTGRGEEVINLDIKNGFDLRGHSLDEYREVDYVWFLAWDVGGAKYLMNPDNAFTLLHNNLSICNHVFSFLKETRIPFMFASTQLVNTDNVYGLTKIVGEEYTRHLNGKIIRFWNVYGWEEPGEKAHVITDLVLQALTKNEISLMTNGEEERQFIHIYDCVRNMVQARDFALNKIDFTNNKWIKIKDIAAIIAQKFNCPIVYGEKKGYENKIDADETHQMLNFNINIADGIDMVINDAKKYLRLI